MDPDANLKEQREIIHRVDEGQADGDDLLRLADLAQALDGWITAGGFLPRAWALAAAPVSDEDNSGKGW